MKRCPECRKDYVDDTLLYCLDDGAALVQGTVTDEPATAILSGDRASDESLTRQLAPSKTAGISSAVSKLLSRERLPWIIVGLLAVTTAVFGYNYYGRTTSGAVAMRLSFEPPKDLLFNDTQPDWAVISPDGEKIAFTANTADGKYLLYVNELKTGEVKPLPGSDNALEPFWSPDSKSIAYGSRGKLKRSDITGGNAQVLTDAPRIVAGAWNSNGDIIFCPDYGSPMFTVAAKGGESRQVTFHEDESETSHSSGTFLPDGRRFLFNRGTTKEELRGLWMGSLDSKEVKRIIAEPVTVRFAPPDQLIMVRNQVLVAQTINTTSAEPVGEPVPIVAQASNAANAPARFSVSRNGVIVWQPRWERSYQLRFFDRDGKQTGAIGNPELMSGPQTPQISPDGKQVAFRGVDGAVWVSDLAGANPIKLGNGQLPIWEPEGGRIVFSGVQNSGRGIMARASNGVGETETLLAGTVFARKYSPDGKFLLFTRRGVKTRVDIWLLQLFGERKEIPLLVSPADEINAEVSPNGEWLAYTSDETGASELYVQSFHADGKLGSDRKRISGDEGAFTMTWSRDGKELFYVARDGRMMSVAVTADGPTFASVAPKPLFDTRMLYMFGGFEYFDVTPDGKFLIGTLIGESTSPAPTVVLNWHELVKK